MKLTALSVAAAALIAPMTTVVATGVAHADAYAGQTYADASAALSNAKLKGVIATRAGDTLPTDQCIVTRTEKAPWIKGTSFAVVSDTVLLFLNCNATVASATQSGNSAASPEGRAAIAAANAAATQEQSTAAANQNAPANQKQAKH